MKVATLLQPPNPALIQALEEALADAKSGKLQGALVFAIDPVTGEVAHWMQGVRSFAMFAWAVECWRHRVLHQHQEGL